MAALKPARGQPGVEIEARLGIAARPGTENGTASAARQPGRIPVAIRVGLAAERLAPERIARLRPRRRHDGRALTSWQL